VLAYARQIRAMNLRDLLMWRCGAAGRNINSQKDKLRRFVRCHHPLFSVLRHGLNRKSSIVVYQFHGESYHQERKITFVANGDHSTYSFAVSAAPITSRSVETVGQRHFDIGLKRCGQLFSERFCIPPRHIHQRRRKSYDNNCCYRLNPCGIFIQPLHSDVSKIPEGRAVDKSHFLLPDGYPAILM